MPELIKRVEDESNVHEQCMDLNEEKDNDLICDNCGLRFSVNEYDEGDICPECSDGDLILT